MAVTATISSASGETAFEFCPLGTGTIALTGTSFSAGKVLVAVRPPGASADFISDYIDVTAFQEVANEAANGYSYVSRFDVGPGGQVALKADANFVGSLSAQVSADLV